MSKNAKANLDKFGMITYSDEENLIWSELLRQQTDILKTRACEEYLTGLASLNYHPHRIPQLYEINKILQNHTGWSLTPVSALLPDADFFALLANRKFPVATFIRDRKNFDYIQEPDIFHELVGHCPLLLHRPFADSLAAYARIFIKSEQKFHVALSRIFFFTVETGLIKTPHGLRIYGSGILSSKAEALYALSSESVQYRPFNIKNIIATNYNLSHLQKIYYVIKDFDSLYRTFTPTALTTIFSAD